MAKAFKCDRCGSMEKGAPKAKLSFVPTIGITENDVDLCDRCVVDYRYFRNTVVRGMDEA